MVAATAVRLSCSSRSLAILRVLPGGVALTRRLATFAVDRAPFWMLLVAVAGGQLLFNKRLPIGWRLLLLITVISAFTYAFVIERATASNWVSVAAVSVCWLGSVGLGSAG